MFIPLPLLFVVQRAIDFALENDPQTQQALSAIDGTVFCISVLQPNVKIYLLIADAHVEVAREFDAEVDAIIEGSASALLSLLNGNDALYTKEVTISGNLHVANELKAIASNFDLDIEELLSGFTGDTIAHQLGRLGRGFGDWLNGSATSVKANAAEYLQEEAEFLAPNSEVNRFCNEIDELRTQYDRLQARIALLEQKNNTS